MAVGPTMNRRQAMMKSAIMLGGTFTGMSGLAQAAKARVEENPGLEDILLGQGQWTRLSEADSSAQATEADDDAADAVPPNFATYASRFLVRYDEGASSWWSSLVRSNSLLPNDQQEANLGRSFGSLARSLQLSWNQFLRNQSDGNIQNGYGQLLTLFLNKYGQNEEARRHIGLLFAMLRPSYQPSNSLMNQVSKKTLTKEYIDGSNAQEASVPTMLNQDLTALLPQEFECVRVQGTESYTIYPPINLYEVGVDEEFGQTAIATTAGPLASNPLRREQPNFSLDVYTLFGISGATGCALTHTVVIPLDVVKTRMQTDPGETTSLLEGAASIVEKEGPSGLLLGSQATMVGYLWYGLSVYPSYTFFKRLLSMSVLPPEIAAVHGNDVALVAGALASVVASLGLTPMEACRIRTVAEPETYKPIGLLGTLQVIASEDAELGWRALYAGLPSLLTRQVIFGSVKFLAFERACEAIFKLWPILQDATWTSLTVSLVAGGFSGCLSSVVSQPADSVLTYVAQNSASGSLGIIDGCRVMMEKEGAKSLFRGLGSRCVWAGSIIAGQFLLYDVFRTFFQVSGDDLSQIFQVVISKA